MKTAIASLFQKIASLLGRLVSFFSRLSRRLWLLLRREKAPDVTRRESIVETKPEIPSRFGRIVSLFGKPAAFLRRIISFFSRLSRKLWLLLRRKKAPDVTQRELLVEPKPEIPSRFGKVVSLFGKLVSFLRRLISFFRKVLSFLRRLLSPFRKLFSLLGKVGRRLWLLMPGKRLLRAVFRRRPVSKRERYYYVRYATSGLRIIAWVVLVTGLIAALAWGIGTGGMQGGLQIAVGVVGAFLAWLVLLTASELLKLLMDVKENTEHTAEGAFTIMKQR